MKHTQEISIRNNATHGKGDSPRTATGKQSNLLKRESYKGEEMGRTSNRLGAYDFLEAASLINGQLIYRADSKQGFASPASK